MKVTYYLEVMSSWCYWVLPVWDELKACYEKSGVQFDWKIAAMKPDDFPVSRAQCDWFYRRSGMFMNSPVMLNSGWFEAGRADGYEAPNLVAEAARSLGVTDDRAWRALIVAALREGQKVGDLATSVKIAAKATKLETRKLRAAAESKAVRATVAASTAEFFAHQLNQRPSFILTNDIADKAVFSGLVALEPLAATIDEMREGEKRYAAHKAHFGMPPAE